MKPLCGESTTKLFGACGKPVWKDGRCAYHHPDTLHAKAKVKREREKLERILRERENDLAAAKADLVAEIVGTDKEPRTAQRSSSEMLEPAEVIINLRVGIREAREALRAFEERQKGDKT
jgi:hypothetical protein